MNSVEDLDVFKLAHQLALRTYSVTKEFPREELFSLTDQTRRAAGSVGMNLMEGACGSAGENIVNSSASPAAPPAKSVTNCFSLAT